MPDLFAIRPSGPIAGVDEAGRGPLAGPVSTAAVILDLQAIPAGLADSKILPADERERLFGEIMSSAIAVSVAFASAALIDRINIRAATLEAMRRAVAGLSLRPVLVEIDGRDVPPGLVCEGRAIIDGDAQVAAISAASIVAKVARDRLMTRLGAAFPAYGFERHMGYATAAHRKALAQHGPCPHHRRSFAPVRDWQAPAEAEAA